MTQESIELKAQASLVPSLERTIKIKNIEVNSLKQKSTSGEGNDSSMMDDVARLKDEEIEMLRKEN